MKHTIHFSRNTLLLLGLVLSFTGAVGTAHAYDAYTDWTGHNPTPNGVWRYGYSQARHTSPAYLFVRYDTPAFFGNLSDLPAWTISSPSWLSVFRNATGMTPCCSVPPYTLGMHPGQSGESSIIRFTAPADGYYQINAKFSPTEGATVKLAVLAWTRASCNCLGTESLHLLWEGHLDADGSKANRSYTSGELFLPAGGWVDFVVNTGDNDYVNDTTAVQASVFSVSAPESVTCAAVVCPDF